MKQPGLIVGAVFLVALIMGWLVLNVGSKWFAARQSQAAAEAKSDLEGMFIFTEADRILAVNIAALIMLPIVTWLITGNLIVTGMSAGLALLAPRYVLRFIAHRRLLQFEQQLPDALMMVTGALRAGASLSIALESVANECKPPISQEFALLLREIRLGKDFGQALDAMEQRVPLPDLALVTSGMALSREVGANLAETLDSIAKTIRAKLQMEGKIRSLTAQGKMQGIVMAGLPFFLVIVLRALEPEAMAPLFNAWYGWVTLAVMVVAISIGYHFIRKITTIDV
jgi:tight adherence protein B